jgi:hypothetical protein
MKGGRQLIIALRAALATPRAVHRDIARLVREPATPSNTQRQPPNPSDVARVLALTDRVLRLLARIPGGPWRTTCLYRSVAECLALHRLGLPAVIRLGVRADDRGPERDIMAHAWVECWGKELARANEIAPYSPLRVHAEEPVA